LNCQILMPYDIGQLRYKAQLLFKEFTPRVGRCSQPAGPGTVPLLPACCEPAANPWDWSGSSP